MTSIELKVLQNYLKSGLSTRRLDKLLGHDPKSTKGWTSWTILKKYKLKDCDKGRLFLYSPGQSKEIITNLAKDPRPDILDLLIDRNPPRNLEKYRGTYILTKSEDKFCDVFSGETRNIIQSFFKPQKDLIGRCQYKDCRVKNGLDTVHYLSNRPKIFKRCAKHTAISADSGLYKHDVYKTMKLFLESHARKKSICFLCKKHHNEFHRLEKKGSSPLVEFKKNIIFN